jgi:RNA polymerase sigma-70 factor (ECF subfamily)
MKKFESQLTEQIPRLRRYARALSGNAFNADDLVQDTLERALNKKSLWQRGSRLRPWLFTIMHNLYVNQRRRYGAMPGMSELDENIQAHGDNPESHFYAQQLQLCIALLPDDQKSIFLLVSLEGFAYEEVANILDIPVGTVMSRLSRAREKLRKQISTQSKTPLRRVK